MSVETESLRERLVEEAIRILGTKGGSALTVRAVAQAAGCSTMGVYTHFRGKPGLLDAIMEEGFADFSKHLSDAVDHIDDGRERLRLGADAYREWALTHRTHYMVMFTPYVPGYEPSETASACGTAALADHRRRVEYAIERGDVRIGDRDAEALAIHIWATVHGHVLLELWRGTPQGEEAAVRDFRAAMSWFLEGVSAG